MTGQVEVHAQCSPSYAIIAQTAVLLHVKVTKTDERVTKTRVKVIMTHKKVTKTHTGPNMSRFHLHAPVPHSFIEDEYCMDIYNHGHALCWAQAIYKNSQTLSLLRSKT